MEQAEPTVAEREAHERYGWVILSADVALGIVAAMTTTLPPLRLFTDPLFEGGYSDDGGVGHRAGWASTILALVMILDPLQERTSGGPWWTLWLLPLPVALASSSSRRTSCSYLALASAHRSCRASLLPAPEVLRRREEEPPAGCDRNRRRSQPGEIVRC